MIQKTADGLYTNYLHVGKLIVAPQFGFKETDDVAVETIKKNVGYDFKIATLKVNWIAKSGGLLNCSSWGILK